MLPPIMVDGAADLKVEVGKTIVVTTPDVTKVTTDNEKVLKVSQPRDDGSATYNAGADVLSAGDANLVVYGDKDKELYTVTVVASEKGSATPEPSSSE